MDETRFEYWGPSLPTGADRICPPVWTPTWGIPLIWVYPDLKESAGDFRLVAWLAGWGVGWVGCLVGVFWLVRRLLAACKEGASKADGFGFSCGAGEEGPESRGGTGLLELELGSSPCGHEFEQRTLATVVGG